MSVGIDYKLEAVRNAQLAKDARQMMSHCDIADKKSFGDLFVFQALSNKPYDVELSLGEAIYLLALRAFAVLFSHA
jgi:hypothetical protein